MTNYNRSIIHNLTLINPIGDEAIDWANGLIVRIDASEEHR